MIIKEVVRSLVPRPLYSGVHRLKRKLFPAPPPPRSPARRGSVNLGYAARPSFAAAVADAGPGYQAEIVLSGLHDRAAPLHGMADIFAPFLASVAVVSRRANGRALSVLDFGGGSGHLRSYARTFLGAESVAYWHVVETAAQVSRVGRLDRDDVRFSTSIDDNRRFDLAVFSGSLHCVEDWQAPLRQTDADWIYIARTPLGDCERPFLQLIEHDGVPVSYPGRVIGKTDMVDILARTHRLFALWKFEMHLFEMGICEAPAMLWCRA